MGRGVHTGELLEGVGPEGHAVRAHDVVVLVDPDHRGDVADGIELGEEMVRVDQDGKSDHLGPRPHLIGRLVDRHPQHHEARVAQLLVQGLPPGQVVSTASPSGESDQQLLPALPLVEVMVRAVEVGQGECRRPEPVEGLAALLARQGHGHQPRLRVHNHLAPEGAGDRFHVEAAFDVEGGGVPHRHADVTAAQSLGFERPSEPICSAAGSTSTRPSRIDASTVRTSSVMTATCIDGAS